MRVLARAQPLNACSELTGNDAFEMRRLIFRTAETGREQGFTKSPHGYNFCVGDACSIRLHGTTSDYLFFHTHPEAEHAAYFSINDLRNVFSKRGNAISCLGFEDENSEPKVKCVFGKDVPPEALAKAQQQENAVDAAIQEAILAMEQVTSFPPAPSEVARETEDFVTRKNRILRELEDASKVCSEALTE